MSKTCFYSYIIYVILDIGDSIVSMAVLDDLHIFAPWIFPSRDVGVRGWHGSHVFLEAGTSGVVPSEELEDRALLAEDLGAVGLQDVRLAFQKPGLAIEADREIVVARVDLAELDRNRRALDEFQHEAMIVDKNPVLESKGVCDGISVLLSQEVLKNIYYSVAILRSKSAYQRKSAIVLAIACQLRNHGIHRVLVNLCLRDVELGPVHDVLQLEEVAGTLFIVYHDVAELKCLL